MHSASMLLFPLLALLLALAACDSEPEEPAIEGEFSFLLDGTPWEANRPVRATLTEPNYLSVSGEHWIEDRFPLLRGIDFSLPFEGPDIYPFAGDFSTGSFSGGLFAEQDGDAIIAFYYGTALPLPDGSEGRIVVDEYNAATGAIAGTFRGVFVVDSTDVGHPRRELPDTLVVTEGVFRATVDDRRD